MNRPVTGLSDLPVQAAKSRLLLTLVVDTSSSMEGERIAELNAALQDWRQQLVEDDVVRRFGEIAMITFGEGHVNLVDLSGDPGQAYVPVSRFDPPPLRAGGVTPMIDGLQYAFTVLADRRQQLRKDGFSLLNRSLVYLITDGVPTDENGYPTNAWRDFAPVIRRQEEGRHLLFFAFGVDGADEFVLRGLAPRAWRLLADARLADVLSLVSTSIEAAAASSVHDMPADQAYDIVNEQMDRHARMREFLEGKA
ncbi:VWA domain-containing protein [Pseudonocardia yuanmonensis]|uniref:VWA domain-containing protein n=1 Tax=Pseudonocardia yuanmonensis TaxID=1095914 RepID=A0ABP8VVA8_9PSEU